ncbi:MAG TPA: tetratricopeptide repeat protein [Methyloceanibacter sp.]|nr:tetratricopeptide repeat protein [Methyloceanibacter sp.]
MTGWMKWAVALAMAVLAMGTPALGVAGDTSVAVKRLGPPDVEARREALLQQMIASPSDLDLAFEYTRLSSQVGDYEAAVSTLERMLIYAPNNPPVPPTCEAWPYYYGISPTGAYPDYPDIRQLYYDGATTQILLQGAKPVPTHDPIRRPIIPPEIPDGPCNSITHC